MKEDKPSIKNESLYRGSSSSLDLVLNNSDEKNFDTDLARHFSQPISYDENNIKFNNMANSQFFESSSFYGRMGSRHLSPQVTSLSKLQSGTPSRLNRLRVQFLYDENAFPELIQNSLYAFIYDKDGNYLDTIFYRHPEDSSGAFYLNSDTQSIIINFDDIPSDCYFIVLAISIETFGLNFTDLIDGRIEFSDDYLAEPFYKKKLKGESEAASGLIFMILVEYRKNWLYEILSRYSKYNIDSLMASSGEYVQQVLRKLVTGDQCNLSPLEDLKNRNQVNMSLTNQAHELIRYQDKIIKRLSERIDYLERSVFSINEKLKKIELKEL